MNKRYGWIIGMAAALALAGCSGGMAGAAPEATSTGLPEATDLVVAEGQLVPKDWVNLSFTVSGRIERVSVEEGDQVRRGEPLAQLDDAAAQQAIARARLNIQQAQISVATAKNNLDDMVDWSPNKGQLNAAEANLANAEAAVKAAQSEYDQVAFLPWVSSTQQSMALEQATNNFDKARGDFDYLISNRPDATNAANNVEAAQVALTAAELSLKDAEIALDQLSLLAPFTGTVTDVSGKTGEVVAPGQQIVTLANIKDWIVETDNLTELEVTSIEVGQSVTITFDAIPGKTFQGEVTEIAQQFEEKNGDINYTVRIALKDVDPLMRWGMTASLTFNR